MSKKTLTRSVSIIGVGQTPYGDPEEVPEIEEMSLQDMGAWACANAMEDAGVNPRQIGKLVLGMVCSPAYNSETLSPNHGFLEFVGMKGLSGVYHNEVCITAMNCFNEAIEAVASGRCDIAIAVDSDSARRTQHPYMPSCFRFPSNEYEDMYGRPWAGGAAGNDTAYVRWTGAYASHIDAPARHYIRKTGIAPTDMDDAMIGANLTARFHASRNPKTYLRELWEDFAKERGYDDVWEFMRSKYNPKFTEYMRTSFLGPMTEGAAAIIVCATEIAGNFRQTPIEIVGYVQSDMSTLTPAVECRIVDNVGKLIYERTGYKPEDIEYLQTSDMDFSDCIYSTEAVGYLPRGEAWRYFRDGLTKFNSEKPINTDGGHSASGHSFSASHMAAIIEPVLQMRNQAGERQIPKPPKVSMFRGQGSWQSNSVYIFKTVEDVKPQQKPIDITYKAKPLVKMFYDALAEGKFLGMKCLECGNVEFPPYPICNKCGNINNELIEVSGEATVNELYSVAPALTPAELAAYAPIYSAEVILAEGSEFLCLIFGVTPENYEELRDNGPFKANLVAVPDGLGSDFNTFGVSINGVIPSITGDAVYGEDTMLKLKKQLDS